MRLLVEHLREHGRTTGRHHGAGGRDDLEGGEVVLADDALVGQTLGLQHVGGSEDGQALGLGSGDVGGEARCAGDHVEPVAPQVVSGLLLLAREDDAGQTLVSVDAVVLLGPSRAVHVGPGDEGASQATQIPLPSPSTHHSEGLAEPWSPRCLVDRDAVQHPRADALVAGVDELLLPLPDHVMVVLGVTGEVHLAVAPSQPRPVLGGRAPNMAGVLDLGDRELPASGLGGEVGAVVVEAEMPVLAPGIRSRASDRLHGQHGAHARQRTGHLESVKPGLGLLGDVALHLAGGQGVAAAVGVDRGLDEGVELGLCQVSQEVRGGHLLLSHHDGPEFGCGQRAQPEADHATIPRCPPAGNVAPQARRLGAEQGGQTGPDPLDVIGIGSLGLCDDNAATGAQVTLGPVPRGEFHEGVDPLGLFGQVDNRGRAGDPIPGPDQVLGLDELALATGGPPSGVEPINQPPVVRGGQG